MSPIARNTPLPGTEINGPPSTASEAFFFGQKNIFFLSLKKNKKNSFQKTGRNFVLKKRITPLLLILTLAALSIFFMPAGAEEGGRQPEQVACPEISKTKVMSSLDEYAAARAYDKGQCGFIADGKTAKKWYLKAAKHGYAPAQYQLGEKYFTGNGAAPDYPKAKRWYLAAARQGHGLSQLRLGFLYAEAHFTGLKPDYTEAEKWFLKASEQDAGDARFRLGNFYHNYKKPPEPDKAILWLTKAAEGGHRVAMYDLALMIKNKSPQQALAWLTKAAELDLLPAQMSLSEMYAAGDGVARDPLQSLAWTLKIAAKPTAAPFWIDRAGDTLFEGGDGIPKDYPQALRFYERAAAKNDPHALARLGQMYLQGLGVAADAVKARKYLQRAAANGSDEAKGILKGYPDDKPPEE